MPNVFISYRREDTAAEAGRLYDALKLRFDDVFRDIYGLKPGEDFAVAINRVIARSDVVLVLIGRRWLTVVDGEGRRRLDDPEDVHGREIAAALQRRGQLVIPVLIEGARMPRAADLPAHLAALATRHALELSDARWEYELGQLIATLEARKASFPGSVEDAGHMVTAAWRGLQLREPGSHVFVTRPDLTKRAFAPGLRLIAVVSAVWAAAYLTVAIGYSIAPGFTTEGPGDLYHSTVITLDDVPEPERAAVRSAMGSAYTVLRRAEIAEPDGPGLTVYYALENTTRTSAPRVVVMDAGLHRETKDARRLKPSGVWPYVGQFNEPGDWIWTALYAAIAIFTITRWAPLSVVRGRLARRSAPVNAFVRPLAPVFGNRLVVAVASTTVFGLALLPFAPGWNAARKLVFFYRWLAVFYVLMWLVSWSSASADRDLTAQLGLGIQAAAVVSVWGIGWFVLRPAGRAFVAAEPTVAAVQTQPAET